MVPSPSSLLICLFVCLLSVSVCLPACLAVVVCVCGCLFLVSVCPVSVCISASVFLSLLTGYVCRRLSTLVVETPRTLIAHLFSSTWLVSPSICPFSCVYPVCICRYLNTYQ